MLTTMRDGPKWERSQEVFREIEKLKKQGCKFSEIAERFGVHEATVRKYYKYRKEWGRVDRPSRSAGRSKEFYRYFHCGEGLEKIRKLLEENKSYEEIGRMFDVSGLFIKTIAKKRLGLLQEPRKQGRKPLKVAQERASFGPNPLPPFHPLSWELINSAFLLNLWRQSCE